MATNQQTFPAPFVWSGNTGQQLTPGQVKIMRELAAAKVNKARPTNLGEGLSSVGDALLYVTNMNKANEAESAGHQQVMEALAGQRWGDVMADPWADPAQQGYAGSMMQRGWDLADRDAGWAREDQLRSQPDWQTFDQGGDIYRYDQNDPNSTPELWFDGQDAPPGAPKLDTIFDPDTGRNQSVQWTDGQGPLGGWDPVGGVEAPSDPLVTVNTGDTDSALDKKLSEAEGMSWSAIKDAAMVAGSNAQDFAVLDELLKVAPQGPVTGRLAETFQGFSSAGDAVKSIVKRIAPTLRVPGSGATSDIEYQGMLQSLAALPNTPESNRMIMSIMKAKQDINIRRGDIVTAYQNGEIDVAQARQQLAELNRMSIITPEMKQALLGVGASGNIGTTSSGLNWSIDP